MSVTTPAPSQGSRSFFDWTRTYPEPFADEVDPQPDLLVASVELAHATAQAPFGDEGDGYDMHLMVRVLLDHGWTPPARLLAPPDPASPEQVAAAAEPFDSVRALFPHLWEGAEGGRTVGRLIEVFERAYPGNGTATYQRWCRQGYAFAELRATLTFALGAALDRLTREQVSAFAATFGLTLHAPDNAPDSAAMGIQS